MSIAAIDYKTCNFCTYENLSTATKCEICEQSFNLTLLIDSLGTALKAAKDKIDLSQNFVDATEKIPELLIRVDMLYIPCSINNNHSKMFIDTGAQVSLMSKKYAEKCGLLHLINTEFSTVMTGIGKDKSLGRIWLVDINIGDYTLSCSFDVLENFDIDLLFGLNMMMHHGCIIDCKNKCLNIGDIKIGFVTA